MISQIGRFPNLKKKRQKVTKSRIRNLTFSREFFLWMNWSWRGRHRDLVLLAEEELRDNDPPSIIREWREEDAKKEETITERPAQQRSRSTKNSRN